MDSGRVLVVHETGATRALLRDLLAGAGFETELVESTYGAMARYVDTAADLVILGLARLEEKELAFIDALKAEEKPPRVLVMFPTPRRDVAVRALKRGADGYLLEPFYAEEILSLARSLTRRARRARTGASVTHLAEEVAHAINNPLQVMRLLLDKDRVTKRELTREIPEHLERIEAVVKHLQEFGTDTKPVLESHDLWPIVQEVARQEDVGSEAADVGHVRVDANLLRSALANVFVGMRRRCPDDAELRAKVDHDRDYAAVRLTVPRDAMRDADPDALLEAVFTVEPDRSVLPGLAGPRALLQAMHGTLDIEQHGEFVVVVARVPLAR